MISPHVRRLRLGNELKALRATTGITLDKMASRIEPSRQQISRYELGQIAPDLDDIMQILDVLGVEGKRWTEIMTIAREAAERGWWESNSRSIGERQALFANLEAGARTIREYGQTIIPGLLQTAEFTRARVDAGLWPLSAGLTPEGILKGRAGRQRMMHREGGPTYEVIIDEYAIRRRAAPATVLHNQLKRLAELSADDELVILRVLPIEAEIGGYDLPFCSFALYTYADPLDPVVVGIDASTTDVVLTEPDQASRYTAMFDSLREAAMPEQDSRKFLIQAAQALPSA